MPSSLTKRQHSQRGAVALIVALSMTALLVAGAFVLDIGLARFDRGANKGAADAAVTAGLQSANAGTGDVYNSSAVCAAYEFLIRQRALLSGLPAGICATPSATATCTPGDTSTNVSYSGTTTVDSRKYDVWIKMPYSLSDPTGGAFSAETSATSASDVGDATQQGCDQIGVIIKESTKPGLSAVVNSNDLVTRTRSVARVKVGNGDPAPALLLLERTHCGVLAVGSAGSPSRIKIYGNTDSPGTIHSDSDASDSGCGSGNQVLQGKQADGVAAYGSATGVAGLITTVATQLGKAATTVVDSGSNVYGTSAQSETGVGTKTAVVGRKPVTRKPVDRRYLAGVALASRSAYPIWLTNPATAPGFTRLVDHCPTTADMTMLNAMTAAQSVYINCPAGITATGNIGAGTVYLHGYYKSGVLNMSQAQRIYIDDKASAGDAINVSTGNAFCVRATSCVPSTPSLGQCSSSPTGSPTAKATLFSRTGSIGGSGTSSLLRLCNTTVIMQSGDIGAGTAASPGACLPSAVGAAPTSTPCPPASAGNGPVNTSGVVDWTAPNAYGDMTAAGLSTTQQQTLWDDGEDLAAWDETYGDLSTYKLAGGASIHVGGVFMVPNAFPFNLAGGGSQDLTNAQFVVRSFAVAGGAILTMKVDPNNVVGLPSLYDFRMVR